MNNSQNKNNKNAPKDAPNGEEKDRLEELCNKQTPFAKKILAIKSEDLRTAIAKLILARASADSIKNLQSVFIESSIPEEARPAVAWFLLNLSPINGSALRQKFEGGFAVPPADEKSTFIDDMVGDSPV